MTEQPEWMLTYEDMTEIYPDYDDELGRQFRIGFEKGGIAQARKLVQHINKRLYHYEVHRTDATEYHIHKSDWDELEREIMG